MSEMLRQLPQPVAILRKSNFVWLESNFLSSAKKKELMETSSFFLFQGVKKVAAS